MIALDLIPLFVVALLAVFYRRIIGSKWLNRWIAGFEPTPETDDDIVKHLDRAEVVAAQRAEEAAAEAEAKKRAAANLRRRLNRKGGK